jgi:hypothetical protein
MTAGPGSNASNSTDVCEILSYYLVNPPQGANNLVLASNVNDAVIGAIFSFTLEDIVTPSDHATAVYNNGGGNTSTSVSISSDNVGNMIIGGFVAMKSTGAPGGGTITSGTAVQNTTIDTIDGLENVRGVFGYLNAAVSSPGSQTFAGTWTGTSEVDSTLALSISIYINRYNAIDLAGD